MWLKDLKIEIIVFSIKCELKVLLAKKREKHIFPFFEVLTTQIEQKNHETHALCNNEPKATNIDFHKPFFFLLITFL